MNDNPDNKTRMSFGQDMVDCWHRLPNKAFFFTLLAGWLLLFQFYGNSILGYIHTSSLFAWLYYLYNIGGVDKSTDDSYGNFIPFLVIGLFWWKRKELLALPLKPWWPGLLLLAAAMVLHILGFLVQQPLVSVVALFAGIYALMGMAWGREWLRHCTYPFSLFVFSIPLTAHLNFILFPLRLLVCRLVEMVAHLIGIDVIRNGTQLMDPSGNYGYDVAAACGGMRSLIAIFLLATIYAFGAFRSPWKRILSDGHGAAICRPRQHGAPVVHHHCGGNRRAEIGAITSMKAARLGSSACCLTFPGFSGCFSWGGGWKGGWRMFIPSERNARDESKVDSFFHRARIDCGDRGRIEMDQDAPKTRPAWNQIHANSRAACR